MGNSKKRVLLVEDSRSDAKLVARTLWQIPGRPFKLTTVDRLQLAINTIHRLRYDIILLDLGLPDSKGISTFSAIHSECRDLPIVILTISSDESIGIEAISRGAQDYFIKGTSDERGIAKAIRYAIERKRLEVEQRITHEKL